MALAVVVILRVIPVAVVRVRLALLVMVLGNWNSNWNSNWMRCWCRNSEWLWHGDGAGLSFRQSIGLWLGLGWVEPFAGLATAYWSDGLIWRVVVCLVVFLDNRVVNAYNFSSWKRANRRVR